jgi:DoxX-like protein
MTTTLTARTLPHAALRGRPKVAQIGIWISTGLFAATFAFSGAMFIAGPSDVVTAFRHLGYPDYFRELLGIAKLLGVAALIYPLASPTPREWAYAGSTFVCIAAFASHLLSGDPLGKVIAPMFALALLLTSYFLRRRAVRIERAGA